MEINPHERKHSHFRNPVKRDSEAGIMIIAFLFAIAVTVAMSIFTMAVH
jgi:hypothetical protein